MIAATVAGNLGRDAETKSIGSDTVCEFSVASTRKVKGEDATQWVRCTLWGKRGEALRKYLVKGVGVVAIGELTLREYQKKGGGGTGVSLELRVSDIKLMGGKRADASGGRPASGGYSDDDYGTDDKDSDIPF